MKYSSIIALLVIAAVFGVEVFSQGQQKSSSIFVHDNTAAADGGEKATSGLRSRIESELQREKPCVEMLDDQDFRDAINDERDRELLEGGDSTAALKAIGDRFATRLVASVKAMPGPGGATIYSAFVMDTSTARSISRSVGSEQEVAESLVKDIAAHLADQCKPHWVGSIILESISNQTKSTDDEGTAHATRIHVKRNISETSNFTILIKASLKPPAGNESVNSPKADVIHRTNFTYTKNARTQGETRCRERGRNPYYTGFNESITNTTTMIGQGTDLMPVFIAIASDGSYTISVTAPKGVIYGKEEKTVTYSGCPSEKKEPTNEATSLPDGVLQSTSFEVEGKVDPRNKDQLSGSISLPDGKTKITWSLRMVKPKGK